METRSIKLPPLCIIIVYFIASIWIILLIDAPGIVNPYSGMIPMTEFKAERPFMYRAFMPLLIRGIESLTPNIIKQSINDAFEKYLNNRGQITYADLTSARANVMSGHGFRIILYLSLTIISMLLFLLVLRSLMIAINEFPKIVGDIAPLGMIFVIPLFYDNGYIMYDFPHLYFITLCLFLLWKRSWSAYLIAFSLAILNKETALLLIVIFAFYYYGKMPSKQFWRLMAFQIMLFVVVKIPFYLLFHNNPGSVAQLHLHGNLEYLSHIANYFFFSPMRSSIIFPHGIYILLPRGLNFILFIAVAFFMFWGWRHKPPFLKIVSLNIVIVFIMGMVWGIIFERRIFYDILPVVYLLSVSGLIRFVFPSMATNQVILNGG